MISLRELKYVNQYASRAPFPGEEYAKETLEMMKYLLEIYKNNYKGKEYSVIFSDASELDFTIFDFNLSHMLGIDFKGLTSGYYDDFLYDVLGVGPYDRPTSYELANLILDNSDKVIEFDSKVDRNIPGKENRALNYYKSHIKCEIFNRINDFDKFNFGKLSQDDNTHLLYLRSNEPLTPYYFVRLKEADGQNIYCVTSLLAAQPDEIKSEFRNSASIPTQIIVDDNKTLHKHIATPKDKLDLFNEYNAIVSQYRLKNRLDISGDYISILSQMDQANMLPQEDLTKKLIR